MEDLLDFIAGNYYSLNLSNKDGKWNVSYGFKDGEDNIELIGEGKTYPESYEDLIEKVDAWYESKNELDEYSEDVDKQELINTIGELNNVIDEYEEIVQEYKELIGMLEEKIDNLHIDLNKKEKENAYLKEAMSKDFVSFLGELI